jgi:hypothetical protein
MGGNGGTNGPEPFRAMGRIAIRRRAIFFGPSPSANPVGVEEGRPFGVAEGQPLKRRLRRFYARRILSTGR